MKNHYLISGIIILVVGGAAFYGGIRYQQSKTPAFSSNGRSGTLTRIPNSQPLMRQNRLQAGEIIEVSPDRLVVKYPDNTSKIVLLTPNTRVTSTTPASSEDLKLGSKAMVIGSSNADGSQTAQAIQLNP